MKDPELLAVVAEAKNPLVTTDGAMPMQHADRIGDRHPGIVAIRHSVYASPRINRTMTTRSAARILASFKSFFAAWHDVKLQDCVLFISEADVELSTVRDGKLKHVFFASFLDDDSAAWPERLKTAIDGLSNPSNGSTP